MRAILRAVLYLFFVVPCLGARTSVQRHGKIGQTAANASMTDMQSTSTQTMSDSKTLTLMRSAFNPAAAFKATIRPARFPNRLQGHFLRSWLQDDEFAQPFAEEVQQFPEKEVLTPRTKSFPRPDDPALQDVIDDLWALNGSWRREVGDGPLLPAIRRERFLKAYPFDYVRKRLGGTYLQQGRDLLRRLVGWQVENTLVKKLGGPMKASAVDKEIAETAVEDLEVALGILAKRLVSKIDDSTIAALSNPRYIDPFDSLTVSSDSDLTEPEIETGNSTVALPDPDMPTTLIAQHQAVIPTLQSQGMYHML